MNFERSNSTLKFTTLFKPHADAGVRFGIAHPFASYDDNSLPQELLKRVKRIAAAAQTLSLLQFTPTDRLIIRAARNL